MPAFLRGEGDRLFMEGCSDGDLDGAAGSCPAEAVLNAVDGVRT